MTDLLPGHAQPKVRRALSSDKNDIANLLREIMSSDSDKERILKLSDTDVNLFMTLLREVCNYSPSLP
jgi:hypothetical protein